MVRSKGVQPLRADVHAGSDGTGKSTGIVIVEDISRAEKALSELKGFFLRGQPVEVRIDDPATLASGSADGPPASSGAALASQSGPNPATTTTVPSQSATNGVAASPGSGLQGSKQLHIKNLPWSTSNEDLFELFVTIAPVRGAEILFNANGSSRGEGLVEFTSVEEATSAKVRLHSYVYGGRPLDIEFNYIPQPLAPLDPVTGVPLDPAAAATAATDMAAAAEKPSSPVRPAQAVTYTSGSI